MRMLPITGAWLLLFQLLAGQGAFVQSAMLPEPPVRSVLSRPAGNVHYLSYSSQGTISMDSETLVDSQDLDTSITLSAGSRMLPHSSQQTMIGWLELTGDADATVWLNGVAIGTTPLERLTLYEGSYQLIITKPEHNWYGADLTIDTDLISTVNYTLQEQPRKKAVALSMVLPGSGHIYQREDEGWISLDLALVFGYSALVFQQSYAIRHDTYNRSLDDYNSETDASIALEKREIVQKDFNAMKKVEKRRNICLGALGTVWIMNIIDIAL